jgi:hypothetical protein
VVSSIRISLLPRALLNHRKDKGQYDDEIEIFWASELVFYKKRVYRELHGFDDDFLPIRKKSICAGYNNTIKYNYKSTVYHVGGATLQQGNPKKTF